MSSKFTKTSDAPLLILKIVVVHIQHFLCACYGNPNKDDRPCHPNTHTERKLPCEPARLCSEKEASEWFTARSAPWYYAQGLTPPSEEAEKGREQG
jgi:hypothetical protein